MEKRWEYTKAKMTRKRGMGSGRVKGPKKVGWRWKNAEIFSSAGQSGLFKPGTGGEIAGPGYSYISRKRGSGA